MPARRFKPSGGRGGAGTQGPKGDTGDVGPKGDTGDVGPKGDTGDVGPKGDTGDVGPKGDTGDVGPKGDTGDVGPKGDTGDVGPKGDTGDVGPKGDTGDVGPKGDTGDVGPKGDTGDVGPAGETGPAGADAPSTFLGLSDTPSDFTGQAGKVPTVNEAEDALVFETPSGGGGGTVLTGSAGSEALVSAGTDTPSGDARGAGAVDLQNNRFGATQVASALGSGILSGAANSATQSYAVICGGYQNLASGAYAFIGGGRDNEVSDQYSTIGGGQNNEVSGKYATIPGGYRALADHYGEWAYGASNSVSQGQSGFLSFTKTTTNATPANVNLFNTTAQWATVAENETWMCTLTVSARQDGSGGDHAGWKFDFLAFRNGSGDVEFDAVYSGLTPDKTGGSPSGWVVGVSKLGSNIINLEVTGEDSHNIRWVARLDYVKSIYA